MFIPSLLDDEVLNRLSTVSPAEPLTIWDSVLRARSDHAVAVCPRHGTITYGTLAEEAVGLARYWYAEGVLPGSVVILQLRNCYEFLLAHVALTRLGAITLPIDVSYGPQEVAYIAEKSKAMALVGAPGDPSLPDADVYDALIETVPSFQRWWSIDGDPGLRDLAGMHPDGDLPEIPNVSDITMLMPTGGTTGNPKLAAHSHASTLGGPIRQIAQIVGIGEDDTTLLESSRHVSWQYSIRMTLMTGGTLILEEPWDATKFSEMVQEYGATWVLGAPRFLSDLCNLPLKQRTALKSLRRFVCGGTPIPASLAELAAEKIPGTEILRVWGMSETGMVTSVRPSDTMAKAVGSDGAPVPGWEVRIVADGGSEVPPETEGEIQVRGTALFHGYLYDENLTKESMQDGWFRTGDFGRLDKDGYVHCLDRLKNTILREGMYISAVEIEELVRQHPAVSDVAIVGDPDPQVGERVAAFIISNVPQHPTVEELSAFLLSLGLPRPKLPETIQFVDAFPVSNTGKVQRFLLRAQLVDQKRDAGK